MQVEPRGMPAALKAWREREPPPLLTLRCGAASDCHTEVGAVYHTPHGPVVESWLSVPQQAHDPYAPPPVDLASFADELGVVGLLDDFPASTTTGNDEPAEPAEPEQSVVGQIDMLTVDRYWTDPTPVCPHHGELALDRAGLTRAVRAGETTFPAGAP
jgi:hypothetical protein